jgi:transcriptional regulator with XRE-family HTH domain
VIEVEVQKKASRMARQRSRTPGGAKLRRLRTEAGKPQLWVELAAELGTGYLQRLESGKVRQPGRATLARILTALEARYSEQREVFELFGYTVTQPPPTDADMAWACAVCQRELHEVPFPAYVLDCTHRLVTWNRYVPYLFGMDPNDPTLGGLARRSLLATWFATDSPLVALVAEPAVFFPALMRAFRSEMQPCRNEPWCEAMLVQLQRLPRFRHYWAVVEGQPALASAARALVPLRLVRAGVGHREFRLASEHFIRDARFRLVYYFPADLVTMQQCMVWAAQEKAALVAPEHTG